MMLNENQDASILRNDNFFTHNQDDTVRDDEEQTYNYDNNHFHKTPINY